MPDNDEIEVICKNKDEDKWVEKGTGVDATALVEELNAFPNFQPKIGRQQRATIKVTIRN